MLSSSKVPQIFSLILSLSHHIRTIVNSGIYTSINPENAFREQSHSGLRYATLTSDKLNDESLPFKNTSLYILYFVSQYICSELKITNLPETMECPSGGHFTSYYQSQMTSSTCLVIVNETFNILSIKETLQYSTKGACCCQ